MGTDIVGLGHSPPLLLLPPFAFPRQDPYCVVQVGGQNFRTRVATDGGRNPVWNETFRFEILNENELQLEVKDDQLGHDAVLGTASISLARARQLGADRVEAAVISPRHRTQHGVVSVAMQWEPNGGMRPGYGGGGYSAYAAPPMPMQQAPPPMQQYGGGYGGGYGNAPMAQPQQGYVEEVVVVEQPAHHRHHHHQQQQQEVIEIVRPY